VDLTEIEAALAELCAQDAFCYGDAESVLVLQRVRALADLAATRALGEFDDSGDWAQTTAQSATSWVITKARVAPCETRVQMRRARSLCHLPAMEEAWAQGAITGAHFSVVAKLRRPSTEVALARDEEILCQAAQDNSFADFVAICAYWDLHANPDGAEERDLEQITKRNVTLTKSIEGMFFGHMTLDPVSGAVVYDELARLERELFEADRAEATERLGRDPLAHELVRTSAQRRADALVEMATRSRSTPAGGRRPAPLVTVLIGWESLFGAISELEDHKCVLSPRTVVRLLDGADLERAVFSPENRVEVSETSRYYVGASRRILEVRDQGCVDEYCDQPASACQGDHIVQWTDGGLTTQENGRLLCPFHNRQRNQRPKPKEPDG
jgi:hypothetical protein